MTSQRSEMFRANKLTVKEDQEIQWISKHHSWVQVFFLVLLKQK